MKIVVADDEPIEREALRVLLQRHLPEVSIVGEAGSGTAAVGMVESLHPDVVLMDIDMPGLSGLEALREIRERSQETHCVMVSAYDYFHFAREAFRLGAVDYLLKPVKREQMLEVLTRLAREIEAERQRRQDDLRKKEQLRGLRPLAEAELAALLMRGEAGPRVQPLREFVGVEFAAGLCMLLGFGTHAFPPQLTQTEQEQAAEKAYQHLSSLAHSLCACVVGPFAAGEVPIFVALELPVDEYQTRLWSQDLGRRLRDRLKEQTGVRFRVGIGTPFIALTDASRSYREALTAYRFEGVSDKTTHFGDLAGQVEESDETAGADTAAGPVHLARTWRPTPAVLLAVEKGKQFLRAHYAEEISLESMAQEVALTPYYFSKIFSRIVGETLFDYLARIRVEEAKRLLTNPLCSVKEACFAVGYNDPNYFSRVFKKVTGRTPTEFRAGIGIDGSSSTGA